MKKQGFSVTYEIITEESAEYNDTAENGYILENGTLGEAIAALEGASVCPSCMPFNPAYPYTWFTTYGECDYRTGDVETRALHMPRDLTPSTRCRIAALLGVHVRQVGV